MNIPEEITNLKNTHLAEWLPDAATHFKYGSTEWCMGYCNSAAEYIKALEQFIEALPDGEQKP